MSPEKGPFQKEGTPPKTNMTLEIHQLKMYFLLKMGIFQCHVSFQGCTLPTIFLQGRTNCHFSGGKNFAPRILVGIKYARQIFPKEGLKQRHFDTKVLGCPVGS